jgi:hypothetical protein
MTKWRVTIFAVAASLMATSAIAGAQSPLYASFGRGGTELDIVDLTSAALQRVNMRDMSSLSDWENMTNLAVLGGKVYFQNDGAIFEADPDLTDVSLVWGFSASPTDFALDPSGKTLYASFGRDGTELDIVDLTSAALQRVNMRDISNLSDWENMTNLAVLGGKVYFQDDGAIFEADPDLTDVSLVWGFSDSPTDFALDPSGKTLYASFGRDGTELDIVDLTSAALQRVNMRDISNLSDWENMTNLAVVSGKVYFQNDGAIFEADPDLTDVSLVWGFSASPADFALTEAGPAAPEPSTVALLAIGFISLIILCQGPPSALTARQSA